MSLKHKVIVNVERPRGVHSNVIKSGTRSLRERFCRLLFGEKVRIMVISPGDSVETVEIHAIKGAADG